eukprot:2961474-Prymnesium_polylepis.2
MPLALGRCRAAVGMLVVHLVRASGAVAVASAACCKCAYQSRRAFHCSAPRERADSLHAMMSVLMIGNWRSSAKGSPIANRRYTTKWTATPSPSPVAPNLLASSTSWFSQCSC